MNDRRNVRRASIDMFLNKYIGGEPHLCRAVNLSTGGLLVYKLFEPDDLLGEVGLEFQLPGTRKVIRTEGVTLAVDGRSRAHAIRFVRMRPEDALAIAHYLEARANSPSTSSPTSAGNSTGV